MKAYGNVSIRKLAATLVRGYKNVHTDVKALIDLIEKRQLCSFLCLMGCIQTRLKLAV